MGLHIIAEFLGVKEEKIATIKQLKPIVERVVKKSGLNVVSSAYHQFKPYGVTCVYLLMESHLAIHTWPEVCYMAVDIFTCGKNRKAKETLELLRKEFSPKKVKMKIIGRLEYEKLLERKENSARAGGR
ncbi:MAG: adenosylmethionine decarboxylase [Candidatus Hadarchaeales archaeon]